MRILSRAEELIMVSLWRLGGEAYTVPILEEVQKHAAKDWTLSAIYIPLGRLERKGYVESYLGEPTSERGGKRKRYYRVTKEGFKALKAVREIQNSLWNGLSETLLDDMS
jgi:DNA-binding PadR family transcriptional regulator